MRKVILLSLFTIICCTNKKHNNWTEYRTKDSIPLALQKVLASKNSFKIANPNEKYNSTDMITDSLPDKQLRYITHNENTWRLAYTQGGFGKYNVVVECRIKKDSVLNLKYWETLHPINNNSDFEELIRQNKIRSKNAFN